MSALKGLIIYMAIGGLLVSIPVFSLKKECDHSTSVTEFASLVAIWPALIVAALAMPVFGVQPSEGCGK